MVKLKLTIEEAVSAVVLWVPEKRVVLSSDSVDYQRESK